MLVLSRKRSESIQIGENVVVSVQAIQGNKVRLGIKAPDEVRIVRTELTGPPADSNQEGLSRLSSRGSRIGDAA